ncbi:MAG: tRNA (guanosine(37)-N1)-methyltransferase TrmD [Oscillospiraceae bacterium]|nr:tRNA (guanosine(37)-N1)-methyltransferase TrmD [Oscillospiraceae bacterium]
MIITIFTLFPDVCDNYLNSGIIGKARQSGNIEINCVNIRDYAGNKHNRVDDKPYGGGTGMLMQAEPVYSCVCDYMNKIAENPRLIYMSPQGEKLNQELVKELSRESHLFILCGHYEGIDCRALEKLSEEYDYSEVSVGDYVVTGGELPALILTDAVSRLIDGVLPNSDAYTLDSHWDGLLEHPQYTRPENWRGKRVPETLLSGHHANIEKWKSEESLKVTSAKRSDLIKP